MVEIPSYFSIVNLKKADICGQVQVAEFPVVEVGKHVVGCRQKEQRHVKSKTQWHNALLSYKASDEQLLTCQSINSFGAVLLLSWKISSHRLRRKYARRRRIECRWRRALLLEKWTLCSRQTLLTWVLPLPVWPYAKHVAMLPSKMDCTKGLAVNLKRQQATTIVSNLSKEEPERPVNLQDTGGFTCRPGHWWQSHRRSSQSGKPGCPSTS